MSLFVYNTLSRSKEEFKPLSDRKVNMFVCGQTPYDDAHMGHAKTYIDFDIVARWLRHIGYTVKYIQNITDIEDKIINRAKEKGIEASELEQHYEKRFMEDMQEIKVRQNVDEYPKSNDYIEAMKDQMQILIDKGYAYYLDGDVYYNVAKFKDYTKLSGVKLDELEKHRIEPKEGKINIYDFALWKAAKPGEPFWKIRMVIKGKEQELVGRPGWHLEDTAITYTIFGPQYDIHGGASELIFTHHSNEIAQAEAAYGRKPFVKYWLHSGVLNVNNVKMSKSLKNFITIRDVLKSYPAEALRLFVASTHYKKDLNYTEALMKDADKRLRCMYAALNIFYNMPTDTPGKDDGAVEDAASVLVEGFTNAMNNDFDTPLALSVLMKAVNQLRVSAESHMSISRAAKERALKEVLGLASTLGILELDTYKEKMPEEVSKLITERERLRKLGRFEDADRIRTELSRKHKITLEDTEYGTIWYRGV
jgi:cysteinyl-tRNA synthetase